MRIQRAVASLAIVAALGGLGATSQHHETVPDPVFTALGEPTMPFVPYGSFITSSWYCPGVPAGADGLGGNVVVTNFGDEPIRGRLTVYTTAEGVAPVSTPIAVEARAVERIDLTQYQPQGAFVSALVEIDDGGGFVEQQAIHPAGNAVAACSNAASSSWYFAEGFTVDGSEEQLVLTNPFPDTAIVDVGFVTVRGARNPARYRGFPVPGHSVRIIDFGSGAKDEPIIAAEVIASRGRLVAARSEHFVGGGRVGYSMALGAPSLASQYYFADGEVGTGITEEYRVFNPTDQEVTVDVNFLGAGSSFQNDTQLTLPAGGQTSLDTKDVAGLPVGRHGAVFSTLSSASIVVERIITRPAGESSVATTVVMGSPSVLASTRWSGGISSDLAVDDVLVVLNVDNVDTTVSVSTLGPGGLVPVTGLSAVALPAGGVISIPLTDPAVLGRPFVVQSSQRLYVERLLPRGGDLRGRSGSFALAG